jgi:acyl carrier protein
MERRNLFVIDFSTPTNHIGVRNDFLYAFENRELKILDTITGGNTMAMNRDEILNEVQEVLIDALGVDDDEVTPEATLMGDLGAESIDFLDIVFRLEKAFGIKIAREEIFPVEGLMNNPDYVKDGKMTEAGLDELKKKMPHTDLGDFIEDPDINKLGDLFTVNSVVNFIETKLNNQ